jgi:hypothetical protein
MVQRLEKQLLLTTIYSLFWLIREPIKFGQKATVKWSQDLKNSCCGLKRVNEICLTYVFSSDMSKDNVRRVLEVIFLSSSPYTHYFG